jgi:uncharacterized protein (DUF58 family)
VLPDIVWEQDLMGKPTPDRFYKPFQFPDQPGRMKTRLLQFLRIVRPSTDGTATISGRKIYILPSRYGMVFGILLGTLLIASINYANNPAFILTFLLTGVFIQTIFHTWRNLLDLQLRWLSADSVFAGEISYFHFQILDAKGRNHYSIQLGFSDQDHVITDCLNGDATTLSIPCSSKHRGWLIPGQLTLETRFPLGLLRAWCYLDTDAKAIVWPQPRHAPVDSASPAYEGGNEGDRGMGTDDFVGHRGYHPGDQLAHVHWKALAGEKGLLVKQFGGDRVNRLWLDFDSLGISGTEARLQILAGAVQELSTQPVHYGLRLPDSEISPDNNEIHRKKCLDALALFGLS